MIDLHCHSRFSDGELSPSGLLVRAAEQQLRALALTDHDTTEGLQEFTSAPHFGVEPVCGVEISTMLGSDTLHVVGLFIQPDCAILQELLKQIRHSRGERNRKILRRLRFLGCSLDEDKLREQAGEGVTGRPHIARALVQAGSCSTMREAFNSYLGSHGKAYIKRFRPSVQVAIEAVHAAGGVAVWAHPVGGRDLPESSLRARLQSLKTLGLDAVESHYSEHSAQQRRCIHTLAEQLGLLTSGGSDFHGSTMPGIDLGSGRGDLEVPDELLTALRMQSAKTRRSTQENG